MSAPYSPHQNGSAERHWRTLFEMGRCLLLHSNLRKEFWPYAVMTAVYIRNRCFNNRLKQTPDFSITGKKPNLSDMRVFGSECYTYKQDKQKFDPRCTKGIFLGYDKESPAYLVYIPETGKVMKYRVVKFPTTRKGVEQQTQTKSIAWWWWSCATTTQCIWCRLSVLPEGKNAVGGRWVYTIKASSTGA